MDQTALRLSIAFRSFDEATFQADRLDRTGDTEPMMIAAVTKRGDRSDLGSMLANARTLLLRRRSPARTSPALQQDDIVAADAEVSVLGFREFIERTRSASLIERLRIRLGFPREVFERAVRPVIEGYAQFVQLPSASESRQPGNSDELFTRALEVASRALDYRRGQILPRGAAPEEIGAQAHRWTYAVFVAALLCDIATSKVDTSERLAVQLLHRLVPPPVREWLAADPALTRELLAFFSGVYSTQLGAIGGLVLRAAAESGGRDLLQRGRADRTVQVAATAVGPRDVKAEAGAEPALNTKVAAQPDSAATSTNTSGTADEETEYLEGVGEKRSGSVEQVRAVGITMAQASNAARRFMAWLQQGLADGDLRVNEAGALVHFVTEGMLLVSPRIFREFAMRFGEEGDGGPAHAPAEQDIGKFIQRQVLRADWHLRADKGVNILSYQVMRGERAVSRLSGVVIRDPARFVKPVPPINPLLVRLHEARGAA
ncbi:MAG: TraI domain-containing protein [Burkholderiales bacterium]|nr:TraI domain-containing protein [Burkholderiales bacterium]